MKPIIILGGGGHARSTLDVIHEAGFVEEIGILDDSLELDSDVLGAPVIGTTADVHRFMQSHEFLIGVGKIGRSSRRRELAELVWSQGGKLACLRSPFSHVSRFANVEAGSVIFHRVTVNAGANVGKNCIINSHALIEHDSTIGDHTHISTGALVNGGCVVGEHSFIGSGAILHHNVTLPAESVVPAGTVVTRDWTGPDR